jgi:SAM-dependent methyltransferase
MMFGSRDEFDYLDCSECGTVQLAEIPDLAAYYPKDYYSFEASGARGLKERLSGLATRAYFRTHQLPFVHRAFALANADARLIDRGTGLQSVLALDPSRSARILDVGCGSADLLKVLARLGFTSLTGIDKFLPGDSEVGRVRLRAAEISEIDGEFDMIMFHHSLEHIPDPAAALKEACRLLDEDGTCLVRIPLLSYAWEKYGIDWVGLDAPRHLVLMKEATARKTMEASGFTIADVVYDSTSFQFSASEKYSLDIPLDGTDPFSKRQLREWHREAKRLNRERRGDQAAFVLKKQK